MPSQVWKFYIHTDCHTFKRGSLLLINVSQMPGSDSWNDFRSIFTVSLWTTNFRHMHLLGMSGKTAGCVVNSDVASSTVHDTPRISLACLKNICTDADVSFLQWCSWDFCMS